MDVETIKLLLESQQNAYQGSLKIFLDQVFTKINEVSGEVTELKRSLEYSQREIDDLKGTVRDLKETQNSDRREIARLHVIEEQYGRINELNERIIELDDGSRRNNLRIDGLEETAWENAEQSFVKVQAFLKEQLDMEEVLLDHAHRIGPPRDNRPRNILVRFSRLADRDAALRNARKLRGSVFVYEDLCPESQRVKKERYNDYKKAKAEGKIAYFRGSKLFVRPRHPNNEASGYSQTFARPMSLNPIGSSNPSPHILPSSTASHATASSLSTTLSPAAALNLNYSSSANENSQELTGAKAAPAVSSRSSIAAQPSQDVTNDNNSQNDKRKLRDRK